MPENTFSLKRIKSTAIWVHYEEKKWKLLNPKIESNWRSPLCLDCGNILDDNRAYCTNCGYSCGHWDVQYTTETCFICGKSSTMLCVQCDRPVCKDCSDKSKSGCHYVGGDGSLHIGHGGDITQSTTILTCIKCKKDMENKQKSFRSITYENKSAEINNSNEYVRGISYKSLKQCLWHDRSRVETCHVCNKPLCEICCYFEIKSLFGFNTQLVGPICFGHISKGKNWTIFLGKEGISFTTS